jgi:hypothetical protein
METRYKPRGFPQRLGSLRLPLFPQPRRRYYLPAINLGVGPFYSIKVGSFYVVKVNTAGRLALIVFFHFSKLVSKNPSPNETAKKYPAGQPNAKVLALS